MLDGDYIRSTVPQEAHADLHTLLHSESELRSSPMSYKQPKVSPPRTGPSEFELLKASHKYTSSPIVFLLILTSAQILT